MNSDKKQRYTDLYMDIAVRIALMSHAVRLKVGTVVVKDDNIISFGWNGMPSGWDNNCENKIYDSGAGGWLDPEEIEEKYPYEDWHESADRYVRYGLKTKPEVLHSERNALDKLARQGTIGGQGADIFITHSPCLECAKSILGAGIKKVYYGSAYRDTSGIEFLQKSGIEVSQVDRK
jgi:dCMP deaminase